MRNIAIIILLLLSYSLKAQTLEEYFKIAAENNPGLQAKYKSFEASLEKVPQVSTLPDPTFSFGYFVSAAETRVGPQRAKLSLTQMFPWFGTLKAQGDAAALMAEANYQSFIDARNKLFFQVAAAYYPLYELAKWEKIERENIEILQSYKVIAGKKFENGNGAMVDVLRVDIMLNDALTSLKIIEDKEKPLVTGFNKLLNRNEDTEIVVPDSLIVNDSLYTNSGRDSLLFNNPALNALDLKIKASEASEVAAFKQGLPKFGVGLDYILVGERNDLSPGMAIPDDNGKDILMPMVSVTIPIFRRKYRASVKEAQLMQESYSFQKEETLNSLTVGYESVWFDIQQQLQLVELYNKQIGESIQTLNILFTTYGNSGKDFEEVLRMQQQVLRYRKVKATASSRYFTAIARYNYLTSKTYFDESK